MAFVKLFGYMVSRGSAVGIATGRAVRWRGSNFESLKSEEFLRLRIFQTSSGVHPREREKKKVGGGG
jgi:hypothetical protein